MSDSKSLCKTIYIYMGILEVEMDCGDSAEDPYLVTHCPIQLGQSTEWRMGLVFAEVTPLSSVRARSKDIFINRPHSP
jgi:hypothetical protein